MADRPVCPKCDCFHAPAEHCEHDALLAALAGVKLTDREAAYLRWLARWGGDGGMALAGLLARLASAANARDDAGRRADAERAAVIVGEAYRNARVSPSAVEAVQRALREVGEEARHG